jgi:hypothetical protein
MLFLETNSNNSEYPFPGARFPIAKLVRLIVDKMGVVFMIMQRNSERYAVVAGEESGHAF